MTHLYVIWQTIFSYNTISIFWFRSIRKVCQLYMVSYDFLLLTLSSGKFGMLTILLVTTFTTIRHVRCIYKDITQDGIIINVYLSITWNISKYKRHKRPCSNMVLYYVCQLPHMTSNFSYSVLLSYNLEYKYNWDTRHVFLEWVSLNFDCIHDFNTLLMSFFYITQRCFCNNYTSRQIAGQVERWRPVLKVPPNFYVNRAPAH